MNKNIYPIIIIIGIIIFNSNIGFTQSNTINTEFAIEKIPRTDSVHIYPSQKEVFKKYLDSGYINSSIDSTIAIDSNSIILKIYKGKRYTIGNISIKDSETVLRTRKYPKFYKNAYFNISKYINFENKLLEYYENNGFPFIKLTNSFNTKKNKININISISRGIKVYFDSITIPHKIKISQIFLQRYLGIKKGELYNEASLKKAQSKINKLTFLEMNRNATVRFKNNKAYTELTLKNRKANQFNGILGFGPKGKDNKKIVFTGNLNLNLQNPFGYGEQFYIKWNKNGELSQQLFSKIEWPYIFNSSIGLFGRINMYKKDTSFLDVKLRIGMFIFVKGANTIKGYYEQRQSVILTPVDSSAYSETSQTGTGMELLINNITNKLNPQKGYSILFDINGGIKTNNPIDDSTTTKNSSYIGLKINSSIYFPIYKRFVSMLNNQFNILYSPEKLYTNELLLLGGNETLRGFDENQFYTSQYNISTIEFRYLFEKYSHFKIFCDIGEIKSYKSNQIKQNYPIGIGFGLNLNTRAGIFSISYAFGKDNSTPFNLQNAKIHFGYITNF